MEVDVAFEGGGIGNLWDALCNAPDGAAAAKVMAQPAQYCMGITRVSRQNFPGADSDMASIGGDREARI